MRAHSLRAIRSCIYRLSRQARLLAGEPGWEGVHASVESALATLNGAQLYIETRIPNDDRRAISAGKEKAVLAAVKLGAQSQRAVAKATGLAAHDVNNAIYRLRELGLVAQADWKRGGLRVVRG